MVIIEYTELLASGILEAYFTYFLPRVFNGSSLKCKFSLARFDLTRQSNDRDRPGSVAEGMDSNADRANDCHDASSSLGTQRSLVR